MEIIRAKWLRLMEEIHIFKERDGRKVIGLLVSHPRCRRTTDNRKKIMVVRVVFPVKE